MIRKGGNKMDRRQKRTRDAIFKAFSDLLQQRSYGEITVQDIIDGANVGRSTFYAHFETKDHLLKSMCSDIFDHVFEGTVCDYSSGGDAGGFDLEHTLSHILYHLQDHRSDVSGILSSESGEIFMKYIKEYLAKLFTKYIPFFHADVPSDFLIHYLVGSFSETLKWWIKNKMALPPEELARCFLAVIETH